MITGEKGCVLAIQGMKDNGCRERVVAALGSVEGVTDVDVSLIRATAVVTYVPPCQPLSLVRAVVDAGYAALDEV